MKSSPMVVVVVVVDVGSLASPNRWSWYGAGSRDRWSGHHHVLLSRPEPGRVVVVIVDPSLVWPREGPDSS